MTASLDDTLRAARARLAATSDSAGLDARLVLEHVLGVDASYMIVNGNKPLAAKASARFAALIKRRSAGEPVAYLTGRAGFWTLDLAVDARVLIPRPDTETLVEAALDMLERECPLRVADLGTGSGAIALALASECPCWQLHASDASADALACAQANSKRLRLDNVVFSKGRWCAALPNDTHFDAIVSNPPYVAAGDVHLGAAELTHEPQTALVAGNDGLADLTAIIRQTPVHLNAGGWLLLEHGAEQGAAVRALLGCAGFRDVATRRDLGDRERVSLGRKPTGP